MDSLVIKEMEIEDADRVVDIENICFTSPWSKKMFKEELDSNDTLYFCALDDDELIGYVGLRKIFDEGHIMTIAVLPEYRGRGIAKDMLLEVFRRADKDILVYTLEVRASNTPAQKLYEGFGFKPLGIRKRYYSDNGEDAIIMWRE